jgi:hypothetical protein
MTSDHAKLALGDEHVPIVHTDENVGLARTVERLTRRRSSVVPIQLKQKVRLDGFLVKRSGGKSHSDGKVTVTDLAKSTNFIEMPARVNLSAMNAGNGRDRLLGYLLYEALRS